MLSVPPAALSGQGLFERVHVSDRPIYLSTLSATATRGEPGTAELRLRQEADGPPRFIWVEMRCRIDEVEGGRHVVAAIRNISDRKAHEVEVEAARGAAEQANAAKSRFLATMSHELRTPLNAIIGFSELLMNEQTMRLDADRRAEYARLIHESGHHLLAVVNSVLDMSKIESGTFQIVTEAFSLDQLVSSCCAMLQLKAETAGIALVAAVDRGLPEVVADKRACRQIYLNLLSNALKFTPSGGRVTVGASLEGTVLELFVSDTGVGIAGDDLPRLGEAFFQASSAYDRTFEGTGLGLSVVKGLAALQGGEMTVESIVGAGTKVLVRLPLDGTQPRAATRLGRLPTRAPAERPAMKTERGKRRA
jgi:cell cycle sensor histidine kinase DivJ